MRFWNFDDAHRHPFAVCTILRYRYAADVHHWICDDAGPLILGTVSKSAAERPHFITTATKRWIANMIVGAAFLTMLGNNLGNANTFWVYAGLNINCLSHTDPVAGAGNQTRFRWNTLNVT